MFHKERTSNLKKPDYEDSICYKWWNGSQWTIQYKWLDPKYEEITDEQKQKANEWIDKHY